ncbi:carbon storage regulator CsrA [Burkholderia pseudomallei]|uniref:carbon storage regulator CsrA n=1 Tax=Burkholderia pseudomallei TaxID=28450 RepID=UPI0009B29106|nr:carbon storage regulator CsrA [Burkholderia pseudomallei]
MLVLKRRCGERIMIGDDIVVIVLGWDGARVRLGIGAPLPVRIHREEVYRRIQLEEADDAMGNRADRNVPIQC